MAYDFSGILTGGAAARSDSISGLDPEYRAILERMLTDAPPNIRDELRIMSAYRSPETQQRLWNDALRKYGSADKARKWVAPPGRSQHGTGRAIDWSYASDDARNWVRSNAERYGAVFPLAHEPWHMELAGARSGKAPTIGASAAVPTNAGLTLNSSPVAPVASAAPIAPAASPATPAAGGLGALGSVIGALTGGGKEQTQPAAPKIIPSSIGQETGSDTAAQAGLLMATLMADRRKRYGLGLNGMMG